MTACPRLDGLTIYAAVRAVAAQRPEAEALVSGGFRAKYRELTDLVDRCALALAAHGIKAGDRVSILATPRAEVVILLLACAKIGAIYLGLGTRVARADLDYVSEDAKPRLTFVQREFGGRVYERDVEAVFSPRGLDFIPFTSTEDALS